MGDIALTLSLAYLAGLLAGHWRARKFGRNNSVRLYQLQQIQKRTIIGVAKKSANNDIVEVINEIRNENPKVLLRIKTRNWLFYIFNILTFLFGALNVGYGKLPVYFQSVSQYVTQGELFVAFLGILLFSSAVLFYEITYWVEFERLSRIYADNAQDERMIVTRESSNTP